MSTLYYNDTFSDLETTLNFDETFIPGLLYFCLAGFLGISISACIICIFNILHNDGNIENQENVRLLEI